MDDDLFVIPSDDILLGGSDGVFVGGDQDLISESEAIVGPPGPPGPAGRDGRDGVDGQSATVTVGSTTTTAPGTDAIVTNVGTNLNAILDFSIPRGAVGETGPAGADGVDGVDGNDGFSPIATVTQTEYGAAISITDANGTTTADVVNGSQGPQGPAGPQGPEGEQGPQGETGPQGPQGPTGATGATGATGPQGPAGPAGADGTDGTDGTDGFSPIATVTQGTGSATISITDANGTTTATVYDGATGSTGPQGPQGPQGPAGPTPTPSLITTSSYMTMKAGFTASSYSYAYQFGNLMIVQLIINASANFSSTQQKVAVISSSYWPTKAINYSASIGTDEWSLKGVGYLYISSANGEITIADYNNSGCKCAKINLTYIIN